MHLTIHSYVLLVPLVAVWLLVVHRLRHSGAVWWSREQFLARFAFVMYIAAVLHVTLFPVQARTGDDRQFAHFEHSVTIVPLRDLQVADFALNVLMLIPLGLALGVFWPHRASVPVALFVGYVAGAAIELSQLLGRVTVANDRDVTINDVIANALGTVLGVVIYRIAIRHPHVRLQLEWIRNVD